MLKKIIFVDVSCRETQRIVLDNNLMLICSSIGNSFPTVNLILFHQVYSSDLHFIMNFSNPTQDETLMGGTSRTLFLDMFFLIFF